ncbi:bidirectional sugar transporter SWEET16-like [Actinidia eriantha]|uniref:bidirectional sugar transporter SWEET16-like n=1 Tax=Actinidia eriantha TaxID=165200 RepID=UPI002584FB05|nr:bidirectional sugar transporter SWEET16-like [Actinidia eriantha]
MVSPDFIVVMTGNVVSILVYAAPLGTFWKVVKQKSSENYDVLPYIATLLCKSLWTFYGALDPNSLLLLTVKTLILVAIWNIAFVGLVIGVAIAVFHKKCDQKIFMGALCATITIAMYAAPLKAMRVVIEMKSVEYMPFSLSFVLLLNAGCWFTFALILRDFYVLVPNAIGILSRSFQIVLYTIYKNKLPFSKSVVMDEELGSLHSIKEGIIKTQNHDEAQTENGNLNRGNSLHKPALSRLYSIRKIMRTLSMSSCEVHPGLYAF